MANRSNSPLQSAALFFVPAPIKATAGPILQILTGFSVDLLGKRKAVSAFLASHPGLSRADARKIVLGGLDAGTLLAKKVERPVSAYTVSQLYETVMNDAAVTSSPNPVRNTYEFVANASSGVIDVMKGVSSRDASADCIPRNLTKPLDITFGILDGKSVYSQCEGMTGKVFNIALNESTYYKLCRHIRFVVGFGLSLLFVVLVYIIYRIIRYCRYRYLLKREVIQYDNYQRISGQPYSNRPLRLPPRDI